MFENIINFFKNLGKKEEKNNNAQENSKSTAKERLHLVLMQDRANVSADFLELMKQEIIDVIKKYIEIDEKEIDVRLTNQENEDGTNGAPALYANIPIINIKNDARKISINNEKKDKKQESINIRKENKNDESSGVSTSDYKKENKLENNIRVENKLNNNINEDNQENKSNNNINKDNQENKSKSIKKENEKSSSEHNKEIQKDKLDNVKNESKREIQESKQENKKEIKDDKQENGTENIITNEKENEPGNNKK